MKGLVGVVGGGRMGAGIAHAFLTAGSEVALVEAEPDRVSVATAKVRRALDGSVQRGTMTESTDQVAARLRVSTDIADVSAAEVVIEAVPENPDLKTRVLAAVAASVGPDTLIASNTSSLPITHLATGLPHPERFLGMHFFNPVPASQLVEVVVGRRTSAASVNRARLLVASLDKVAITVTDSPGFASSRLGVLLGLEAIRMLQDGVASAEDVDTAMTLGYRHPVGPLRLTDLVGLDVRLAIAEHLSATLGPRFEPPALLRDMVERGDLGRKTGRGFYDWDSSTRVTSRHTPNDRSSS